jgi:hypothetical protein
MFSEMVNAMPKPGRLPDHISPHRAWKSIKIDGEFSPEERAHILRCAQCLRLLVVCLESDSFGAVLQELDDSAA